MDIINQTKDNTCLACVLAMMVGESEKYVLDWFGELENPPPHRDDDAFVFLSHHGIYLSTGAEFTQHSENDRGLKLECDTKFTIEISLETHKAYIIVNSPNSEDLTHAVFWDGKNILDPLFKEPQRIENYKVQHIYPMLTTEQRVIK